MSPASCAGGPGGLNQRLREIVGPAAVLTGADAAAYEKGARYGAGRAACVVRPSSTAQVAQVVALCAREGVAMLAQGANTGLVGASTPDASGRAVLLSLDRLRGTLDIDAANRCVSASAGIQLHALNERLAEHGLCFPIDLGADPSVGGMVATNTGGTRLIRYGDVRHNLLGLEVVLFDPPGEVLRLGRPLRKDNTGFDFKQLFTGTAGACGVITEATLATHRLPQQAATALIVPASDEAVMALLLDIEAEFGDFLSAFEGMSGTAMQAAIDHVPGLRNPFAPEAVPAFALLVELQSTASPVASGLDLQAALDAFLEARFGASVENAVIGRGEEIWRLRHSISEGARALGKPVAFDVSVPRARMMAFRRAASAHVAAHHPGVTVVDFGHVADGGLHFNLAIDPDHAGAADDPAVRALRDAIYDLVVREFGGSFSAEHGVGPHNIDYYHRYTPATQQRLAAAVQGLFNPRALFGAVNLGPVARNPSDPAPPANP